MICDFGDVVAVPFPFVDRPILKRRPALVLTARAFNADNGQSVLAMITTAAGSSWPSDIEISDGEGAGLMHRSVVRWKLFTLENGALLRKLGTLGSNDRAAVARFARLRLAPRAALAPPR
ncbi:MAG: type II toxin-antitoxin system PemK/MazF family toxin [Bauldia sp.]|nr:type II toxin-antitoxin system PemK/MazF family toxin [Bauldia sp.]